MNSVISVGIFNGYFPYTLEETILRLKQLGFSTVQLDLTFKDMNLSPQTLTKDQCRRIRDAFRDANIPICVLSGYTNIVHPDPQERKKRLEDLKALIRRARDLGTAYVVSETGTFNPHSDWVHHPKNKTREGYEETLRVIRELVQVAYDYGTVFLVENYVNNVIGSVDEILRLFADLDYHPALGLLLDPTNFFCEENIDNVDGTLNQILDLVSLLKDRVKIAHAKDIKKTEVQEEKHAQLDAPESHTFRGAGAVELPAPGLGILNYALYLKRLSVTHPNIPLIIEHLDEADVPRAKRFIDEKLKEVGA